MAKYEEIEYKGQPARLYEDGTIRNAKGQALTAPPGLLKHAITSDTAHDMIAAREAKRRRLYAEGAQLAVQDMRLLEMYGHDAHIVERARTLQEIASTPDAGKAAVMADASLRKAQGLEDEAEPGQVIDAAADLVRELARFVGAAFGGVDRGRGEVIDADAEPHKLTQAAQATET